MGIHLTVFIVVIAPPRSPLKAMVRVIGGGAAILWSARAALLCGQLAMALGGCALAMAEVDRGWNVEREPVCTETYVPIVLDVLSAGLLASVAAAYVEMVPDADPIVAPGLAMSSLLYTVTAVHGVAVYKQCRRARAAWFVADTLRRRRARTGATSSGRAPGDPAWCYETERAARCFATSLACAGARSLDDAAASACGARPVPWDTEP